MLVPLRPQEQGLYAKWQREAKNQESRGHETHHLMWLSQVPGTRVQMQH